MTAVEEEEKGPLRIACFTSIVKATELGNAECWIEGKLFDGVFRPPPSRYGANAHG